jgi:uncharacterized ferritin-like protein (DUF455 family)
VIDPAGRSIAQAVAAALRTGDVTGKVMAARAAARDWRLGRLVHRFDVPMPDEPARSDRPELLPPAEMPRRGRAGSERRRIALLHALAHIEFNAINLALDALWRFPGMPEAYYADWLQVAAEEAHHFTLLAAHLRSQGYAYGDFSGHNSLWDMVEKTSDDVLARMALVPRTLEARGLDASPPVRAKLAQAGDMAAAAILDIILRDEIGHVAIGNRWFGYLCAERGLEPLAAYADLAVRYKAPALRGPFNMEARRAAGFTELELAQLGR